jgi:hypothetical protein
VHETVLREELDPTQASGARNGVSPSIVGVVGLASKWPALSKGCVSLPPREAQVALRPPWPPYGLSARLIAHWWMLEQLFVS